MERDDILKLDGDALNARVAIDVMGEEKPVYSHDHANIMEPVFSEKGNWYCLPEWSKGDLCEWKPKRFSDDISSAFEFLENMGGPFSVSRAWKINDKEWIGFSCWLGSGKLGISAIAKTIPVSIWRAVLLAVLDVPV